MNWKKRRKYSYRRLDIRFRVLLSFPYKKWKCRLIEFKKRSCRPVDFKKGPRHMSLKLEKGRVTMAILGVYSHSACSLTSQ